MSGEERARLRTQLREEYRQTKEDLDYNLVQAKQWGEAFQALGAALKSQTPENTRFADGVNFDMPAGMHLVAVDRVPSHQAIESLLQTIQARRNRLREVAASLGQIGEAVPE